MYRITNLRLPVDLPEEELPAEVARRLGMQPAELGPFRIVRKSLDARRRHDLQFVYTLTIFPPAAAAGTEGERRLRAWRRRVEIAPFTADRFVDPPSGAQALEHPPVIVGSGPAGLMAGLYLAEHGYQPVILERGAPVKERVPAIRRFDRGGPHDPESNYLFGEGGAGTFSDGKLTCRMSGPDVEYVLEQFVACGGRPSLRYEHRPHLGSNRLPLLVRNFRRRIEAAGGTYRFHCRAEGLRMSDGRVTAVETSSGAIPASVVILAVGHSARDTYAMLHALGLPLQAKPFQLGLRIEQPQSQIDAHKYGCADYARLLGSADYALKVHGPRDLFTFCMCAGGWIIPSVSEPEMFCTNGMSNSRHETPFANSGLVVTYDPAESGSRHPLAGVEVQRQYERRAYELSRGTYRAPCQPAREYTAGRAPTGGVPRCSMARGAFSCDLREILPPQVGEAIRRGLPLMDERWRGEFLRDAVLVGPEMRGSSPVRIERDEATREVPGFGGLYPVGEGAGYAGGIVSAAVDGLRTALQIVRQFAPVGVS
jgi:hypothetical protein